MKPRTPVVPVLRIVGWIHSPSIRPIGPSVISLALREGRVPRALGTDFLDGTRFLDIGTLILPLHAA